MTVKERIETTLDSLKESMSKEEYKKFENAFYIGLTLGEALEYDRVKEQKQKQAEAKENKSYWFITYSYCNSKLRKGISSSFLSSEVPVFFLKDVTDFLKESNGYSSCLITNFIQIDKATYEANCEQKPSNTQSDEA